MRWLPNPGDIAAACDALVAGMKYLPRMNEQGFRLAGLRLVKDDRGNDRWETRWSDEKQDGAR